MRLLLVVAVALSGIVVGAAAVQAEEAERVRQSFLSAIFRAEPGMNDPRLRSPSNRSPIPRRTVRYDGNHPEGTIVIETSERRLYYTLGNGRAIRYAIGVGREGFTWSGTNRISRKAEWPGWTPPPQMIRREAAKGRRLPAHMPGGINNPLGARALYIGSTLYRIHGTNQPWSIGQAMSSGCIRMANEDVVHLYNQVKIGARVVVRH